MFIIPLPWNRRGLEVLREESDLFDLLMKDSTQQHYLVVQGDTVTWLGQGRVPGKMVYQIRSRSYTMNGDRGLPQKLGNVGTEEAYSRIEDAVLKLFPQDGYCVSNMRFGAYEGQRLRGRRDHYSVIDPVVCLLGDRPSADLRRFFKALGWGGRKSFTCSGTWDRDMKLFIGESRAATLEVWFGSFCAAALK